MNTPSSVLLIFVCTLLMGSCHGDDAIAKGLARIALLSQGLDIDFLLQPEDGHGKQSQRDLYPESSFELGPEVGTTSGLVQGAKFSEAYAFYSVPFAQPPERYQPPVAITTPLPTINATVTNMLVCQQLEKNCSNGVCIHNTNEDCLVLNVHVPTGVEFSNHTAKTNLRPVLVWFYGGGFFSGGATIPEFEARWFANETNAVIVAANYRIGAFGFLVHGEGDDAIKGNQGLKDQQLALQWVNDNIANFGGDPTKITIFGNSAGAQSVMFHLVSDISRPLFQRAIMQSNPAVFQYQTIEEAKNVTKRLLRVLNCSATTVEEERQCLITTEPHAMNAALIAVMPLSLVEDQDLWSTIEAFRPVLDGVEFKRQPFEMFRDGTWQTEKDLIVGTNSQELEIIQYYIPRQTPDGTVIPFPKQVFEKINSFLFGNEIGKLVSEKYEETWEGPTKIDYRVLLGIEASHMFFVCPSRLMARFASNTTTTGRVYLYSNNHPMNGPTCKDVVKPPEMCGMSFHGSEPPFVFRSGPFYGYDFRDVDKSAADQFDYYWANFATTGDPSSNGTVESSHNLGPYASWPQYLHTSSSIRKRRSSRRENLVHRGLLHSFDTETRGGSGSWPNIKIDANDNIVEEGYLEEMCDFWDSLNYYVHADPPSPPTVLPVATTTSGTPNLQHNLFFILLTGVFTAIFSPLIFAGDF